VGVLRRGGLGRRAPLVRDRGPAARIARALDGAQRRTRGRTRRSARERRPADAPIRRRTHERDHREDHEEDDRSPPDLASQERSKTTRIRHPDEFGDAWLRGIDPLPSPRFWT